MCRSAAVVIAACVAVAPVGCSSSESNSAVETSSIRIVIEGETRTVEGRIVCADGPTGEVSIEVDPPNTAPGATVLDPIVVLDLTPQGDAPSGLTARDQPSRHRALGGTLSNDGTARGVENGKHVHGQGTGNRGGNASGPTDVQGVRARTHLPLSAGVGFGIRTEPGAVVETVERGHLVVGQLEVEHVEVRPHPLR